jgi:hypothetical protein
MRQIFEYSNKDVYEKVNAQRDRMSNYMRTADPDIAHRLGVAATAYNWVSPAIIASLVLSNNDHLLPEIAHQIGMKAWAAGFSPSDSRPTVETPQSEMARVNG